MVFAEREVAKIFQIRFCCVENEIGKNSESQNFKRWGHKTVIVI